MGNGRPLIPGDVTMKMNGHFKFHYDEALEGYRNNGRFTLEAWDEIPVAQAGF